MDLFEEFKGVSHQDWLNQITADLKGKNFNENLVTKTEDGFDIQPIYSSETLTKNNSKTYQLNNSTVWEIREQIPLTNPKEANQKALTALKGGANSIQFNGKIENQNDFNQLLTNIMIDIISVHFYTPNPTQVEDLLANYIKTHQLKKEQLNYSIAYDYFGEFLVNGNGNSDFNTNTIVINGFNYTNAGASASQELAYTLNQAVEYIDKATQQNQDLNTVLSNINFSLGINSNYFLEIAKIRAFKILWKLISSEYGCETTPTLHAQTTTYNITAADAQTNILRTTTEAMSAIIGGCNSLSITPFNSAYETPSDFTNRVARNIQILLKEEAYLDKVNEVAKGAYYIEELTDKLVNKVLVLFKEIEANGGFLANITNGNIQKTIAENHNNRLTKYNNNKKTLLGVNKHPNKMETTPTALENKTPINTIITPLTPINLGQQITQQLLTDA